MQNQNTKASSLEANPEDKDDLPVGRILSRREMLALFGAVGSTLFMASCMPTAQPTLNTEAATAVAMEGPTIAAAATAELATVAAVNTTTLPNCVVRPELTEGPYFVDEQLDRSDIRANSSTGTVSEGVPLQITFNVSEVSNSSCSPLAGAMVDVWHCDAQGVYSGVTDNSQGFDTVDENFLRGYQITGTNGVAQFSTIYPGWYTGRAVHIHFKIRLNAGTEQSYEFTSQFFFDDTLSDQVFTQEPYASKGQRDRLNRADNIYQSGGDQLLLTLTPNGDGYAAIFDIGLDLTDTDTGQSDGQGSGGMGGPGGGRPPGGSPPNGTPPTTPGGTGG